MFKLITVLIFVNLLFSCSIKHQTVKDLQRSPQNAFVFVKSDVRLVSKDFQELLNRYFDRFFFSVWHRKKSIYVNKKKKAFWGFYVYPYREVYGENKKRIDKSWFSSLKKNADIKNFPSLNMWGITVSNTDLKVFPTHKPIFYSFEKAGEGFPFDYNQNSSIYAGTPVFISHISKDKKWYFVEAPFASGWVKVKDIAIIDEEQKQIYITGSYLAFIKDDVSVIDDDGIFAFKGFIGGILPIIEEKESRYRVLIPTRDSDGFAVIKTAEVSKVYAVKKPFPLTQMNIAKVINQTLNKPYGWGGLYLNRDCSANIRDIFVPFGVWLPRNSTAQAKSGIFVPLEDLSEKQKETFIAKAGIPFLTLVWMPGHILLFVGNKDKKPYVFHNFWGIRTKFLNKEGRIIVGKSAITTLSPHKGIFFVDKERGIFLKRIKGITYIIPPKYILK
ncbi:MAG: hypothetical protein GXO22_02700 [Aquificae bacterium]|nr:hypothetical protein [Aquificota bacterium]